MPEEKDENRQMNVTASGDYSVAIGGDVNGSNVIVGDHNRITQIIQFLLTPIRRLPTDYAARIENFLRLYLGSPNEPVPFGGREDALRALDAWLDDPARPYALLTAPAGRGKSALLVRWLTSLRQRQPDLPIAFLPVSVRFGTNLASVTFAALTAQLARAFGEEVPTDANTPDEVWRGLVSSYLKRTPPGGRLLVLLDGVDEAANWDVDGALFPLEPPPGLKVIVSARLTAGRPRPADWQRALAWERLNIRRFDLAPLDRPGLRDVLYRMGVPLDELARQPFIIEELYRLTEGDPLLVNLYVSNLWQKGEAACRLKPEDLRGLQPGYQGYFDRWWEDQRRLWGEDAPLKEPRVRELLNLFSAALGPLRTDDLLDLADPAAGLDSWTLEESLKPLARFVVQSGEGYVFAHPRLPEYFWKRLSERERQALERRFLAWGRETLTALAEGRLAPRQTPPYLVRYYRAHLERARAPLDDLRRLVETHAWAQAWEALEGSLGGYLGDVQAVWRQAKAENRRAAEGDQPAPYLGLELRCALIEASLHSLAANLPPQLPALLVQHGHWTPRQALTHIRQMPDEKQRAEALEHLLPHLPPDLLPEAVAAAREIRDADARARVLTALAKRLPPELLPDALAAAREIEGDFARTRVLTALVKRMPPEFLSEALAATGEIADVYWRTRALVALVAHLPTELLSEALDIARKIRDADNRARALSALAEQVTEIWSEALAAAQEVKNGTARSKVLIALAARMPMGLLQGTLAAAREIKDADDRARALTALAPRLPPDLLPEALAAAREIEGEYSRADALTALAPRLPPELLPEALAAVREIQDADARARALTALAERFPELLPEALATAREIKSDIVRARALTALAERLPELLPEALAAAREIRDADDRARVLTALAERLPPELLPEALAAAREIRHADDRARALTALAERFPELLPDALAAAREIRDADARARALTALAERFPELLPEALAAAREIQDAYARADALTALA
ncbi:MAG: hypothetical protein NZP74_04425, partial [Anaerolineales bacterium]|nr:hypothetical protein [Anaerolineales bacterium]